MGSFSLLEIREFICSIALGPARGDNALAEAHYADPVAAARIRLSDSGQLTVQLQLAWDDELTCRL